MADPICGVSADSAKPICDALVHATVLSVKRYPNEEFGVMIHSTGAVVTIRDVKIFVADALDSSHGPAGGAMRGSQDTRDIQEGTQLMLNDVGVWNVNTTALHHARVTIGDRVDIGLGFACDNNTGNSTTANGNYGHGMNNQNNGWNQNHQRFDQGHNNNNFQNGRLMNQGHGNNKWKQNYQRSDQGQFNDNNHNNYGNSNAENNGRRNDSSSGFAQELPRPRKHRMSMI